MTSTKPRLTRIADVMDGQGLSAKPMRTYRVSVDGVEIGTVGQMRATTMHGYANSRIGYGTTRTAWCWVSTDNAGDFELATRTEAVEGLVQYAAYAGA